MRSLKSRPLFAALTVFLATAGAADASILSTAVTYTRAEIDQMATLWETDTVAVSPLATAQYPQFIGNWQYTFPSSSISVDGDIHINMAVNSAGTGKTGNNLGTASPIVGEVINATNSQLNDLSPLSGGRYAPRGIFRFYTEHASERHFEIHPLTQLLRWNGSAFVIDTDYHANITDVPDGATHATSTYTSLLNGSQTVTATVASDNVNVTFTFPSPSVNYVQYGGTAVSGLTSDTVSSYFLFQPALVPSATVKCRLVASTAANSTAATVMPGQYLTVNALTRTDMAAVADQISALVGGQTTTFPRPIEFITLGLSNFGATATTGAATNISGNQATLNGTVNPNGVSTTAYFQYGITSTYGNTTTSQGVGFGTTAINVSQVIAGLGTNASYHFRIVATNSRGTTYGADNTFTTAQQPGPTISSETSTNVARTTATLNATINPNASATTMHFEYGRTTAYGTSTAAQNLGNGATDVSVSAAISGLLQSTLYHFRVVATNANGTGLGPDQVFTTAPRLPTVITSPASNITTNSAILNGSVNPGGLSTTYYFAYGTSTSYGTTSATQNAGSGTLGVAVSADLLAILQPNVTYHFRLVATNSRGTVFSADQVFMTLPLAPIATTLSANPIGFSTATLNGTVHPQGASASVQFEYGTIAGYGTTTTAQSLSPANSAVPVSQPVSGLLANTTYHFRIVATTTGGTSSGADQTFTTASSAPPLAESVAATSIGLTSAVLNATIDPNAASTREYFEFGTTAAYGATTPLERIPIVGGAVPISWAIDGLRPNTTYHFRVVATNNSGTTYGNDQMFNTVAAQQLFIYTFGDVTTASGTSSVGGSANNVIFSNFTYIGTSLNANAAGRFSFTNQPLGATNGSDIFTGTIDLGKYFQMSVTPAAGFTLNVTSIAFTLQRSSTGVRQYSVRSSADSFGINQSAAINPASSNLTIVSTPRPNIFQVTDVSTSANTGSTIMPGTLANALTQPMTFRFYGYNAEGMSGTFSVDDVAIYGAVTNGGVPLITNATVTGTTTSSATLNATIDPDGAMGVIYFVYGIDTNYGDVTASASATGPATISQALAGLTSYTTYHYRVIAANSTGLTLGPDQTFTTAAGDRDGDGMPDDYEVQYGLNPDNPSDAAVDTDGDGYTNLQEYIAGTNPRDATDRLSILRIEMDPDGSAITFATLSSRIYRVEYRDDLASGIWSIAADNIAGTGSDVTITDAGAVAVGRRFYRVTIAP